MQIIKITDLNDKRLDPYVRLTGAQLKNKKEPEKGLLIAESPMVIDVALQCGCTPVSRLTDERLLNSDSVISIMDRCGDIPVYTAPGDVLTAITGFELTRGALAAFLRPAERRAEDICSGARRIAVLEAVGDATNIGAIFRSASALGIDAVLITPTCCDPLCRRAVRVSMGTVFTVPFARIGDRPEDWPGAMSRLTDMGFKTVAMALSDNSISIDDPRLKDEERLAIILGTEGDGLAKSTIAACDYTVKIPMAHGVDSLNVAAAGAVAFWVLTR